MSETTWNVKKIEKGLLVNRGELFRLGTSVIFIVLIMLFAMARGPDGPGGSLLIMAAMIGGYMALNIGANDVANNVGPAVGSNAITLTGAIIIAAIFEASGALIAGGDVVGTIKSGIIDPEMIGDTNTFIWLMMAGLLAAALWLNFATAVGAPVSTTHSIVGGVLGAGVAAGGWAIADWGVVAQDRGVLGHLAGSGRDHRGGIPLYHQADDHLSDGSAGRGAARGADPDRGHGLVVHHVSGSQRPEARSCRSGFSRPVSWVSSLRPPSGR